MKLSVKNSIYQAIINNKWLEISYINKSNENTNYFIGIKDIDIEKGRIYCDIFNPFKNDETFDKKFNSFIYLEGIKKANILEHTCYETPNELTNKINGDKRIEELLEVVNFDNNILRYLSECYRLDE
ncbi:MAG: hypothetical protein J6X03_01200, partial [Bacilli bacterium]|nr:hypothetical protein [Bacilli bacterium]